MGNKYSNKDAFYARLRQLSDIKNNINENENRGLGTLIDYKRGADNVAYGIIKENHKFYIKKSNKQTDPNVADFAYIGGLENIKEHEYKFLSEADKQRNMMLITINEVWSGNNKENINEGIEDAIEDSKEKIDQLDTVTQDETPPAEPAPEEAPPAEPAPEENPEGEEAPPAEPAPEENPEGEEAPPAEPAPEENPEGEEASAEENPEGEENDDDLTADLEKKEIEKLIGKVTNKVRGVELTPDEVKSNINSILSAYESKLIEVPEEDRKDMAERILKPENEDVDNEENVDNTDVSVENEPVKECEMCEFSKYLKECGYNSDSIMECDLDEMAGLIGEFLVEKDEYSDEIYENVGAFMNEDVVKKLTSQYGFNNDTLAPFLEKQKYISEERDKKFIDLSSKVKGMFWWDDDPGYSNAEKKKGHVEAKKENTKIEEEVKIDPASTEVDTTKLEVGDDTENIQERNEKFVDDSSSEKGMFWWENDPGYSNAEKKKGHVEAKKENTKLEEKESKNDDEVEGEVNINVEIEKEEDGEKKKIEEFAPPAMALNEENLRKYIRIRIEENAGLRKKSLNETNKSDNIKKLDNLIDKQYKILSENFGKKDDSENKLRSFIRVRIEEKLGLRKKSLNESQIFTSNKLKDIENMINNEIFNRKKEIKQLLENKK